jgi:DNA-3-methyladenine glycosylase I
MGERCEWAKGEQDVRHHDEEWGVPVHDDHKLFEFLILEGAQAGLSWTTILLKRENYRRAYHQFDPKLVAEFTDQDQQRLLLDPGIVRNRAKIAASIVNAQAFLKIQQEFGSYDAYLWRFVNGEPITNHWKTLSEIPAKTELSDQISRDLKERGMKFVGSTICYAMMQAVGLVNDHVVTCPRYEVIRALADQSALSKRVVH